MRHASLDVNATLAAGAHGWAVARMPLGPGTACISGFFPAGAHGWAVARMPLCPGTACISGFIPAGAHGWAVARMPLGPGEGKGGKAKGKAKRQVQASEPARVEP